jgi:hypothetical protein
MIHGLQHFFNFHKSEVLCFGKAKYAQEDYRNIFGCELGPFPLRYLGIPIHFRKLKKCCMETGGRPF